jgi:hypothetical protein
MVGLLLAWSVTSCASKDPGAVAEEDTYVLSDDTLADQGEEHVVEDLGDVPPIPTGAINGRVVNREGQGLGGLKMLCCTSSLCISGDTEPDGTYQFDDLEVYDESLVEARKMQVADLSGNYMETLFHQDVVVDEDNALERDVVMPPDDGISAYWDVEQGGDVSLAGGVLTLTAPADALIFPFGYVDHMVRGVSIPALEIAPQDVEPWVGHEDATFAFLINPVDIRSKEPVDLVVQDGVERPVGFQFTVWSLNSSKGRMEEVGTASVQDDQSIVGDLGLQLKRLTLLILVPLVPEQQ